MLSTLRLVSLSALLTVTIAPGLSGQATQSWLAPTPEELSMTSIAEVPGAPALYLYKEEVTDDAMRSYSFYSRIKILTEGGKDMANVELPFGGSAGVSLESINARTIHPDGTIVPFTGKPYDKVVEKIEGHKYKERVFTLPDVTVGSIIEYRYKFHYDDAFFMHPNWIVQSDTFVRKAHYQWKPNQNGMQTIEDDKGNALDHVMWTPILPSGAKVEQIKKNGTVYLELNIENVKPEPKEEYMPPIESFSYRVLFYYTGYTSAAEFWTKQGKQWSKDVDKFIGPGKVVKETVNSLVAPGDTEDVKLHKIYAAVAALENTDFTRERSAREDNAAGFKPAQSADDILNRKRGSGDQLAELFVAMTRAAGMKSYLMAVTNRDQHLFNSQYMSLAQLDDYLAIVSVDGKDQFFDPGQRFCPYGQLAWKHTFAGGIRQLEGGNTELANGPASNYKDSTTERVADLALDEQGVASGTVILTFSGSPALAWRQESARGDQTGLNTDLKEHLQHMLPGGVDVTVASVEHLTEPERPLKVTYTIKGAIGSATGKRLLLPANLFESNSKPRFPEPKRELAIDLHYSSATKDAVRYKLPTGVVIESAPAGEDGKLADVALYHINSAKTANSIVLYRNVLMGATYFKAEDYAQLRSFYGKIEAKDQETVVLTRSADAAKSGSN